MDDKFKHQYESIISGEKILYNPLKVKDQLKLIEIKESIDAELEEDLTFQELLKRICLEKINLSGDKLFFNDFEYLIFLIRGQSYGDIIDYKKILTEIKNEETVEKVINLQFNIKSDIKIINEISKSWQEPISLKNGNQIKIKPLTVDEYFHIHSKKISDLKKEYEELKMCIDKSLSGDEVLSLSNTEKTEIFDNLEIEDYKKLVKQFNLIPKIDLIKKEKIKDQMIESDFSDYNSSFFVLS